jgi:YD repeat-containing protein
VTISLEGGNTTTWTYNSQGQVIQQTDPLANISKSTPSELLGYDKRERAARSRSPL